MPIFTELTNALHYVHILYTELQPKWTINAASMDNNSFTPLSKVTVFSTMIFTELGVAQQIFTVICTKIYQNWRKRYKIQANSIYAHTWGTVFTASFIKITNAQRYIVTHVYQIAPQLAEKYGMYVKKSMYTPKKSMTDTKTSFNQLIQGCW